MNNGVGQKKNHGQITQIVQRNEKNIVLLNKTKQKPFKIVFKNLKNYRFFSKQTNFQKILEKLFFLLSA